MICCKSSLFQISIHTFLAEGDSQAADQLDHDAISIHTFLAEGDWVYDQLIASGFISIHTFLAEGDRNCS